MAYLKLGEILVKQKLITEEQLNVAIETQKVEKGRIGEILIRQGTITEDGMDSALATQLGIPYYSSENEELLKPRKDQNLETLIPSDFANKNMVMPLFKDAHSLTCAVYDPLDLLVLDNLKRLTGYEIKIVLVCKKLLIKVISEFYFGGENKSEQGISMLDQAIEKSYSQKQDDAFAITTDKSLNTTAELSLDKLIAKAEEAPVVKLVDLIIRQAIDERASDIHIEPFDNKIHLRYRIDGNLYNIPPPAPHLHLPIISRIKILSKLDIAEKRLPQDGAITAKLEERNVELRVSTIPTVWGEKVVMRILDMAAVPLNLSSLGFDNKQVENLKKALKMPYGLFFVTGPTGSGKSTTLYSSLNETMDPRKNIMTAEDPVEYKLDGINQVAIKHDIGLTFATALKAFLRQDPDIIMVGEVRDIETASISVRAALTGHFVLSTLHTNDAASAITRLMDIGVPNYLLTPSLVMLIGQRLVRVLCQKCKEPYEPSPAQHGGIKFNSDLIYRAKGCEECNHTGFKSRLVIAETLIIDNDIREQISQNASSSKIKDFARKKGMTTIFESGLKKVDEGLTSFDEVCRVTSEF